MKWNVVGVCTAEDAVKCEVFMTVECINVFLVQTYYSGTRKLVIANFASNMLHNICFTYCKYNIYCAMWWKWNLYVWDSCTEDMKY
jgi:hypothetical protein